ncbi:DEAD/DEAH box helicase [Candidatus Poribacteria bacterium]|nr:DEAD/DEAH box helicase [Candidatus Poribacteria bacterium]
METRTFLEQLSSHNFFENQITHIEELPERPSVYQDVSGGLHEAVEKTLDRLGIKKLYSHQATAIEKIRQGKNVVIVTGTASGKTLCYTIPIVEALPGNSQTTMLSIYPTKALAQDQLRGLTSFQAEELGIQFLAGTYDGDTPQNLRRRIRDGANIVLTNPDMLHQGILPQHSRWNRFFTNLRYVVIDEVHAYRGVFGSHLANVMRRLARICRHYGSAPQFICSSATIANPKEHAERICGAAMEVVDNDGSPRGPKRFILWNPPPLKTAASGTSENWRVGGDRRSPIHEAVELMTALVKEGIQTIAFVRTRLAAELIFKDCRDMLRPVSRRLAESIHAYRGGYLPEERREVERKLANKEILGVSSTNALELGIDIGSLDACIMVGYPGTIASLWQQSGRAGRGREASVVFLIAQNAPIDQYLMAHSDYLFAQNPENAVVDADNPHVVVGHLKCAVNELPLSNNDAEFFGPYAETVLELLEEDKCVSHIGENWYWASSEYPAANVNLRNIAGPVYTIQDESEGERVIGTMDEISALSQLHDHAVYIHGADTYFVNKLDLTEKIAFVERRDLDYYTQSVQTSQIQIDEKELEKEWRGGLLGYGDVTITTSIPMFKKIRFHSRDSLGFEKLELPPQLLETVAFWFAPPEEIVRQMIRNKLLVGEALIGIANVLVEVAPVFVMCDTQDIGAVVDAKNLNRDALFLHDRYPGGMGYARRCLEKFADIIQTVAEVIRNCGCEDGCPSCVGSAVPPSAMTDLDSAVRGRIPNKQAAQFLLDVLLKT